MSNQGRKNYFNEIHVNSSKIYAFMRQGVLPSVIITVNTNLPPGDCYGFPPFRRASCNRTRK